MSLDNKSGAISGSYFYKSIGVPIVISGSIDRSGNLIIYEFNNKGLRTGSFNGQLSGNNFVGTWKNANGTKVMPFSLTALYRNSNETRQRSASEIKNEWLGRLTGTHKVKTGSGMGGANTMYECYKENGRWMISESGISNGQRDGSASVADAETSRKLNTLKIVVSTGLSVSIECENQVYFSIPYDQIRISDEGLSILNKENTDESIVSGINPLGLYGDVVKLEFNRNESQLILRIEQSECCNSVAYSFN
jgi:hypothetical protein